MDLLQFKTQLAHKLWPHECQGETPSSAAVLIAIYVHHEQASLLLTRRTDHLLHHPGQISLPGGRREPADINSQATALREAQEEVGLNPTQVEILGCLQPYTTRYGVQVTPWVGWVSENFSPQLDAFEVAELFYLPLQKLSRTQYFQQHRIEHQGLTQHFYALPWQGRFIWGATAAILHDFAHYCID